MQKYRKCPALPSRGWPCGGWQIKAVICMATCGPRKKSAPAASAWTLNINALLRSCYVRNKKKVAHLQSWALSVFLKMFNNKKLFLLHFYQVNNIFLHQSCLKSPLPVKWTWKKMRKIIFYYGKNLKIPQVPSSGPIWRPYRTHREE